MAAGVVPTSSPRDLALPRRDDEARARLQAVAARAHPFVAAGERRLPVAGRLGELLPSGGVQRGSTIAVDGSPGSGSTTVALTLAAAATSAGEWAAVVDPDGTVGGARCRAADAGVALERLRGRAARAARPVGARSSPPCSTGSPSSSPRSRPALRLGDARRLHRARPRARRRCWSRSGRGRSRRRCACTPAPGAWRGLDAGCGLLDARDLDVHVEAKASRGTSRAGAAMTRTGCVWCPDWPVVAARRRDAALRGGARWSCASGSGAASSCAPRRPRPAPRA